MTSSLRRIGFCGVDDSVSPELLCMVSQHYDWVEWGVLFRSDLAGTARYPSWGWVEALLQARDEYKVDIHLAAHLCRDRCQEVLDGDTAFVSKLVCLGFRRAQINATAANGVVVDPSQLSVYAANILSMAAALPAMEFIFQLNAETRPLWATLAPLGVPANMSILHDASCGKGVQISSFPTPEEVKCGYAGGIGPLTIAAVLPAVLAAAKGAAHPVWIDMESSLRTLCCSTSSGVQRDEFSLSACMACIAVAREHGLPRTVII